MEALPKPKHIKKKNSRCKLKESSKARVGSLYREGTHDVCLHKAYKPATWPLHRRDASKTPGKDDAYRRWSCFFASESAKQQWWRSPWRSGGTAVLPVSSFGKKSLLQSPSEFLRAANRLDRRGSWRTSERQFLQHYCSQNTIIVVAFELMLLPL